MKFLSGIFLSLFAVIVAFGVTPDKEGFITDWLVSGPYPNYQVDGRGQAFDTDFLKSEADFVPYPGLKAKSEFIADWGKLVAGVEATNEWGVRETKSFDTTWQKKSSSDFKVSFDKMFLPIDDYFAVYAVCWIESPNQRKIWIGTGSDDDHKIYLNGKLVGKHYGAQGTDKDRFIYTTELQPGLNRLMYKLVDRTGGADFCLRVMDMDKKPMTDLMVYTDHPGRKFNAELYQNGYAGNLTFQTAYLFARKQFLTVAVFSEKKESYSLRLNGNPVKAGIIEITLQDGANTLKLEVLENDKPVAVLQKTVIAYSEAKLRAENADLRKEIQANAALLNKLHVDEKTLGTKLNAVMAARKNVYADLEAKYAAQREHACADGKRSIDEPMIPANSRSRLCINGEWEASVDQKNWSEQRLPQDMLLNSFFLSWDYPVKNQAGTPYPGWEEFKLHPAVMAKESWFKKNFRWDGKSSVTLICGAVLGELNVYVNGEKCGEYNGSIGQLEFPLKKLKPGENSLELHYRKSPRCNGDLNYRVGMPGDFYLDFTNPVKMNDVWVKTSWRKGTLSLTSEIENRTDKEQNVEIRQYAAKDGRIKLKLPPVKQTLEPNKITTFKNGEKWADPLLWGIGGKYGNPDMYELVSDVYMDGKLVDRYIQTFGFREFWIHATDFYLNGKRILLRGDAGHYRLHISKNRDVLWPLLRHDGLNILRIGDSGWDQEVVKDADRMGMLSYVNSPQPILWPNGQKQTPEKFQPFEEWTKNPEHQYNLENYRRWFRLFRNNPSAVIWSTDNEIYTQAWDTASKLNFNIRNDKIGALYGKFMKTLDPDLVMTRDGDVGTWGWNNKWYEDPPCDTANYHYPEFNVRETILDWQRVYGYRPLIYGELLYSFSYHAKEKNSVGLLRRSQSIRQIFGMIEKLEIPGAIGMGLSFDGFFRYDESQDATPWGVSISEIVRCKKDGVLPSNIKSGDQFPWFRIVWPAYSGKGVKRPAGLIGQSGLESPVNWFDPSNPTHVRNANNDAYRETLAQQQPLREDESGECVILAGKPFAVVWSTDVAGTRYGVQADKEGRAWFLLPTSGKYTFESDGVKKEFDVPSRKSYAAKPGFKNIKTFNLK